MHLNEIKTVDNEVAFYIAIEKGNIEIINLLLTNDMINPNIPCILIIAY